MNAALNWSWIYEQVTESPPAGTSREVPNTSAKKSKVTGKSTNDTKGTTR